MERNQSETLYDSVQEICKPSRKWKQVDTSCDCVEEIASKIETKIERNCLCLNLR